MQWFALTNAAGEPAMKLGEEILVVCHAAHNSALLCLFLGRLKRSAQASARPPFAAAGVALFSTWDDRPLDDALVPYAFARPIPPEPKG